MAITLLGVVVLMAMSGYLGGELKQIMTHGFVLERSEIFDPNSIFIHLSEAVQACVSGAWRRSSSL